MKKAILNKIVVKITFYILVTILSAGGFTACSSNNTVQSNKKGPEIKFSGLIQDKFKYYSEVRNLYGYNFVMLNDYEILYLDYNTDKSKTCRLIRQNIENGKQKTLWDSNNFKVSADDYSLNFNKLSKRVEILSEKYKNNQQLNRLFVIDLTSGKSTEISFGKGSFQSISPDGIWIAFTNYNKNGIMGYNIRTKKTVIWTHNYGDYKALWYPDSHGFVFLHSTGEDLGDGAGSEYKPAEFNLNTGKVKALTFKKGFWGNLNWLTPGRTILAYTGYDDENAIKLIDLKKKTEKEILDTYDLVFTHDEYNPAKHQVFITEEGKFSFFDEKGNKLDELPWPHGFDEFSARNPKYPNSGEPYFVTSNEFYYGVAYTRFSPDGKLLAYSIGNLSGGEDDKVKGGKVMISNSDGTGPTCLTDVYLPVTGLVWSPSSKSISLLMKDPNDQKKQYVGVLSVSQ